MAILLVVRNWECFEDPAIMGHHQGAENRPRHSFLDLLLSPRVIQMNTATPLSLLMAVATGPNTRVVAHELTGGGETLLFTVAGQFNTNFALLVSSCKAIWHKVEHTSSSARP
jgi:hypothetical protein